MIGYGTGWLGAVAGKTSDAVKLYAEQGITQLELDYRIPHDDFQPFCRAVKQYGIAVPSIHGITPRPEDVVTRKPWAEYAFMTSLDESERLTAVKHVEHTFRSAVELGAKVVVLHCGHIPVPSEKVATRVLRKMADAGSIDTGPAVEYRNDWRVKRLEAGLSYFPQLMKSLDSINELAVKYGVLAGLENRYFANEYPGFDEFGVIFATFDGGNLRYWHDTGHAQVASNMGLVSHEALLETYSSHLAGVHLHDVRGSYTDHEAPGSVPPDSAGQVDFAMVAKYVNHHNIVKTVELRTGIDLSAGFAAKKYLSQFFTPRGIAP